MTNANHCLTLPTDYNPCRIEPANDGTYLALPITKTEVGVWSLQNVQSSPLVLRGHRQSISALCFGLRASSKLLCTAASDYVIVWNLRTARERYSKGERVTGTIIGTTLGDVVHCCFNKEDTLVAACVDSVVFLLKADSQSVLARLEGHMGNVTKAEFCPHYSSTLVTISDDRTFKVWDVKQYSLVYESSIITSTSLISMAMNWLDPHVTIGTSDGICRTYDLTDGNNFRLLHQLDISKAISKQREKLAKQKSKTASKGTVTVSKRGTWKKSTSEPEIANSTQQGQAILNLNFSYPVKKDNEEDVAPQFQNSAANNILDSSPSVLVVSTTGATLQFNAKNLDILNFTDFQEPLPSIHPDISHHTINATETAVVSQSPGTMFLWAVLGSIFGHEINVVQICLSDSGFVKQDHDFDATLSYVISGIKNFDADDDESRSELNIVAVEALCEKSPLRSEMIPQQSPDNKGKVGRTSGFITRKKPDPLNQALTFKPKVKSSGYTQAPRTTMFKPKINKPLKTTTVKKSSSDKLFLEYPSDTEPPTELKDKINASERPTPVNRVVFSDDGKHVACALANQTASLFKVPIGQNASKVYVGHNGNVNSISWSHCGNMVVTSSDDKTVLVWTKTLSDPIMKFDTVANNMSVNKEQTKPDKNNLPYPKEVRNAQFFFMDKFIILSCGGTLYMYKIHLDTAKDEIKRYLTKSRYKLVQSWSTESQNITSMAAINAFHSHLVICAGSNRDINIFDLNHGTLSASIDDSHSRPVHSLCLNKGSSYASQPTSAYNIFASAAASDCIKLWDTRTQGCVQRLEGHMNNALACGLAISPCGTYLATGSEDRMAYMFDLRTGTYCDRLRGNTDVVTDVCFHPAYPMLVSASLDGRLMSYVPE